LRDLDLISPYLLSLIFSFLALLVSVTFTFEVFFDLKRSLEEKLTLVVQTDLVFLTAFVVLVVISLILLFFSAKEAVSHLHR
jgi:hypothetical protein